MQFQRGPDTEVIDLQGHRVIPGLYDSHLHVIRGGLNYNMELRWEGVPSVSIAGASSHIECVSELISVRAYQLFEDRGHEPGCELNDWLKAEQEIKRHLSP